MHRRALTLFCFGVLTAQLLSISPISLTVPTETFGFVANYTRELNVRPQPLSDQALFSGINESNYDAVLFVGDVLLARNVEYLMDKHNTTYPFQNINFFELSGTPAIVGNFEAAVPVTHVPTPARQITFSVASSALNSLHNAGFTHMSLANNHSLDFGAKGFENTTRSLHDEELQTIGHGDILNNDSVEYVNTENHELAIIAINASERIPKFRELSELFNTANRQSDYQVVYIHWGNEYETTHSKTQKQLASKMVEFGADLIVGHHPHVVQDIDLIDGVPVFYSLGNFVFDQYFSTETQTGLLLKLEIEDGLRIHLVPITSVGSLSQPRVMNPIEYQLFLQSLAERSNPELEEFIYKGLIHLTDPVASSTKTAMIHQYE